MIYAGSMRGLVVLDAVCDFLMSASRPSCNLFSGLDEGLLYLLVRLSVVQQNI